jgi:hypothetical protein
MSLSQHSPKKTEAGGPKDAGFPECNGRLEPFYGIAAPPAQPWIAPFCEPEMVPFFLRLLV